MSERISNKPIEQLLLSSHEWRGDAFDRVIEHVRAHPEVALQDEVHRAAVRFIREQISLSGSSLQIIKTVADVFRLDPNQEMTEIVIQTFKTRIKKGIGSIPFAVMKEFHIHLPSEVVAELKQAYPDATQTLVGEYISLARMTEHPQEYFSQAQTLADVFQLSPEEVKRIAISVCASIAEAQKIDDEVHLRRVCGSIITAFEIEPQEILHFTPPLEIQPEKGPSLEDRVETEVVSLMGLPEEARLVIIRNYMATSEAAFEEFERLLSAFIETRSSRVFEELAPSLSVDEANFRRRVALRVAEEMALAQLFPQRNTHTKKNGIS